MIEIKFRAWDKTGEQMLPDDVVKDRLTTFPKTWELMQGAGLKDKNGKEIYDGDLCDVLVLSSFHESRYRICHEEGAFWLIGIKPYANGRTEFSRDLLNKITAKKLEVIGNVYENYELLEVKK